MAKIVKFDSEATIPTAAKIPIMATTTRSSINVNPELLDVDFFFLFNVNDVSN